MSAAGKSTVLRELASRGHRTVDRGWPPRTAYDFGKRPDEVAQLLALP